MNATWPPPPLSGPITAKLAWATTCHAALGDRLRADATLAGLLRDLALALDRARAELVGTGMVEVCGRCEEGGGSCCGAGIENRYGSLLLLANLLLDRGLPERRLDASSCYFLGPRGCLLRVREVICVNYTCHAVDVALDPERVALLREHEGVALELQLRLEHRLTQLLRTLISEPSAGGGSSDPSSR